jgi:two-component system heavy metal sensor histidine kinase CusS
MTQAQVALSRARTADEYREVIYSAMEEYDRLARMTTDMLLLAKADRGVLVTERAPFAIRPEVEALFEFYDALAESRHAKLVVDGEGQARGEREMFRRAMSNLISNAIRHSKPNTEVRVRIASTERETVVSVSNEGAPIPDVHLSRLFDRFYMVDASRQRASEGSGLGLAIAKSIVEAHGGSVAVTSDARETKFEMKLPAAA